MRKKQKNTQGITIVSLVITIVLILILAIIIMVKFSSNGIIEKAQKSKLDTAKSMEEEKINLIYNEWKIEKETETEITNTFKKYVTKKLGNMVAVSGMEDGPLIIMFINSDNKYKLFNTGEIEKIDYTISTNLQNVTSSEENSTYINIEEEKELIFTIEEGYNLPDIVTIDGATVKSWNPNTGILIINNPIKNVSITIQGEKIIGNATFSDGKTLSWKELKDSANATKYGYRYDLITDTELKGDSGKFESAFLQCTSLTSITMPYGLTSIGEGVFYGCSNLTNITIPNSVTSIDDWAFNTCGLTNITMPKSIISIGEGAFYHCTNLENITIENGITSIGECAFEGCTNLTNITIPNSVTKIEYATFYECTKLTSVIIGDNVTSIGNYAFEKCSSLKSITYRGNTYANESEFKSVFSGIIGINVFLKSGF